MRITFVMASMDEPSGGHKVAAIHAERLRRRGHQVLVVAPPRPRPTLRERLRAVLREGRWNWPDGRGASQFDGRGLELRVLDRWRAVGDGDVPDADVVVATWWQTAEWVAALSPSKGAKTLFIQGYEVLPGEHKPGLEATWRLPFRKIVVSRWLKDLARTKFGDPDALLVPNGVDLDQFHAPVRGKRPQPTVGFLYWWNVRSKGTDVAVAAVERARRRLPGLRVVSFGVRKPHRDAPLPPGTEFHLLPAPDRIRELYAAGDAWLWPSRQEGFGLPILEAMACRTPVIATSAGAAPELIRGGGGVLVRPEDPDEMAAAIVRLAEMSGEEWGRMSEAAAETARGYGWQESSGLFEKALEAAVARPVGGAVAGGSP